MVSAAKVFQVCISIVYDSFILELSINISTALLLWRQRKKRAFFKTFASKKTTHGGWKNLTVLIRKNKVFQLSHRTKNVYRSKLHL